MNDETNKSIEEDWAMSDPDFHLKQKLKADNAEIPAATLYTPPDLFEDENFLEIEPNNSPSKPETEDWSVSVPENEKIDQPQEESSDGWKMPDPIFRSSEGKTIRKSGKKITNPDLPAEQPEVSDKNEFSADTPPQPQIAEDIAVNISEELPAPKEKIVGEDAEKKPKMFFAFGGIFLMLIFATAFVVGIYFLFFHK